MMFVNFKVHEIITGDLSIIISTRIPISTIYIQQCKQKLQTNCNLDFDRMFSIYNT